MALPRSPATVCAMAKRRRSRARSKERSAPPPVAERHFTDIEEAFFAEGARVAEPEPVESFADLDEGHAPRPGLLARLLAKR